MRNGSGPRCESCGTPNMFLFNQIVAHLDVSDWWCQAKVIKLEDVACLYNSRVGRINIH